MNQFDKKTAIISGGAEGIGFAVAKAMGEQGMNIVIGDIDQQQLERAEGELKALGVPVLTMHMDVTDKAQWVALADAAVEQFGKIHMLVNNAGVGGGPGPLENTNYKDWAWVLDVNLMGVVMGAEVVIPRIKSHGEGGWLLNVASMAGMAGVPYMGAYTATKVAVVGMSESWQGELESHNIKVSVLCPAFVKTRIHLSHRNKQAQHQDEAVGNTSEREPKHNPAEAFVENGIPADLVGARVVEALNADEFYIFTHPTHRETMQKRAEAIDQAFARAQQSPLVGHVVDDSTISFK